MVHCCIKHSGSSGSPDTCTIGATQSEQKKTNPKQILRQHENIEKAGRGHFY